MKEILCLGDSLTKGRAGHSFTEYLTNQKIINKGKDGDTLYHSYKRLKKYLNQDKFKNVDTYIISLGTNDILIPFLKNLTPLWYLIMKPREDFFHCLQDDKSFEEQLEKYFELLDGKKIILISIPRIQIKNFPQELIVNKNKIISKLAKKHNTPYIDIYKLQAQEDLKSFSWKYHKIIVFFGYLIVTIFPKLKDRIDNKRKLGLTIDGVHYNKYSAKIIEKEVNKIV